MDITVLLLHADDVGRVVRLVPVYLVLVEGKEAKLEEVLDDDGDLKEHQTKGWRREVLQIDKLININFKNYLSCVLYQENKCKSFISVLDTSCF